MVDPKLFNPYKKLTPYLRYFPSTAMYFQVLPSRFKYLPSTSNTSMYLPSTSKYFQVLQSTSMYLPSTSKYLTNYLCEVVFSKYLLLKNYRKGLIRKLWNFWELLTLTICSSLSQLLTFNHFSSWSSQWHHHLHSDHFHSSITISCC